jgi:hypothetical protein
MCFMAATALTLQLAQSQLQLMQGLNLLHLKMA